MHSKRNQQQKKHVDNLKKNALPQIKKIAKITKLAIRKEKIAQKRKKKNLLQMKSKKQLNKIEPPDKGGFFMVFCV